MKYKRILFKLSGEALMGEKNYGIDSNLLEKYSNQIKKLHDNKIATYTFVVYLVTPNIVMYTATCMDAFFSLFLITSTYLFFYSVHESRQQLIMKP